MRRYMWQLALLGAILAASYLSLRGQITSGGSGGGGNLPPTFSTSNVKNISGLVYDWVMNDGAGNTFADIGPNSNPVVCGGTITWNTTGPGAFSGVNAAHFPGTFSCPSTFQAGVFNPTSATAFSVVISGASFDALNNNNVLVSQISSTANNPGWQVLKLDNTGDPNVLAVQMFDSAGGVLDVEAAVSLSSPQNITTGRAYNFVFTYDGTHTCSGLHIYIGADQFSPLCKLNTMAGSMTPGVPVHIGSRALDSLARHVGYIGGVRIFNGVLTYPQIVAMTMAAPNVDTYTSATRTSPTVFASSFATLDCDLATGTKIGGGTPTNNDNKINATMMTATATAPLDFVLDGPTCSGGVFINSGAPSPTPTVSTTTLRGLGWNTGIFVRAASNHSAVTNGWGANPASTSPGAGGAPTPAGNVVLRDMRLNGNRGTYPSGNSTSIDGRGAPWIETVELDNLVSVLVDHVWIYDSPSYNLQTSNFTNAWLNNSRLEVPSPSSEVNTDGWHIDGPCGSALATNSWFSTGDDSAAVNLVEGYGGNCNSFQLLNTTESGSAQSLRVYTFNSANQYSINQVVVSHLVGSTINNFFNLGAGLTNAGRGLDNIKHVRFSNSNLTSSVGASFGWFVSDSVGDFIINDVTWQSPQGNNALLSFNGSGTAGIINNLEMNNVHIYRNAAGNSNPGFVNVNNSGTIISLSLNNSDVRDLSGSAYAAIPAFIAVPAGGSITTLFLSDIDSTHMTALMSAGGYARVTNIKGVVPGLLTVSTLPSCNAASEDAVAFVSDATAPSYLGALTGGAGVHVRVRCNGTAWLSE